MSLPPNLPKSKTVTFSAETQELDAVLSFVNAPLDALGVAEEEKIVLDIAVEEIYVNIALYAYEPGRGPVTLRWTLEEDPLRIQIDFLDRGTPYDPLSRKDPDITLSAEERSIGGLGIYMVRKSMDEVSYEYRDGQNCFTMKKRLIIGEDEGAEQSEAGQSDT